jgi:dihydrofolate reductase
MINIIVAMSKNRVIGNANTLIWHLPEDLRRFKLLTTGNTIVMGRKTYESIGRPLPNRRSIIITRDTNYKVDGCEVVNSLEEALELSNNNCFIIGGGEIYRQALDKADRLYITKIDKEFEGDTTFPDSINGEWYESNYEEFKNDEFEYSFIQYERFAF